MKSKSNLKVKGEAPVSHETSLTVKQFRFVEEYLVDFNATQAAIRAGYSAKTAGVIGHELLKKPNIQKFIKEGQKKQGDNNEELKKRVMQEMGRIAFFDARKIYDEDGNPKPINELDDDTAACIAGFEVETECSNTRKINEDGEDEGDEIQQEITRTKKIKLADKHGALVSLARHLGMFDKDNVKKVTGDKDNPVVVKIDAGAELAEVMTLEQLEEIQRRVIAKSQSG